MMVFSEATYDTFKARVLDILSDDISSDKHEFISNYVLTYFSKYVPMGVELIFDNLQVYLSWVESKTLELMFKLRQYTDEGIINISSDKSGTRNVTSATNGMNEMQPINNVIDDITSPTSKSKGVSNGNENWNEISPYEQRKNFDYQMKYILIDLFKKAYMPMFEFYSIIH